MYITVQCGGGGVGGVGGVGGGGGGALFKMYNTILIFICNLINPFLPFCKTQPLPT